MNPNTRGRPPRPIQGQQVPVGQMANMGLNAKPGFQGGMVQPPRPQYTANGAQPQVNSLGQQPRPNINQPYAQQQLRQQQPQTQAQLPPRQPQFGMQPAVRAPQGTVQGPPQNNRPSQVNSMARPRTSGTGGPTAPMQQQSGRMPQQRTMPGNTYRPSTSSGPPATMRSTQMNGPSRAGPPMTQQAPNPNVRPNMIQPRGPPGPGMMQTRGPPGPVAMQSRGPPGPITGPQSHGPPAARGPITQPQMYPRPPHGHAQNNAQNGAPYGSRPPTGNQQKGVVGQNPNAPQPPNNQPARPTRPRNVSSAGRPGRIDSEQMPRPKRNKEVITMNTRQSTHEAGGLVPSALDTFVARDDGNANPRFIRMTMNQVPKTKNMMKDASIPFGAVLQPFADIQPGEVEIPVVDKRNMDLERCKRCNGYRCAYTKYDPSTGWWKCHLCQHANGQGQASDMQKGNFEADMYGATGEPDLMHGSCEYIVSGLYAPRILEPVFTFVIDFTIHALASGATAVVINCIRKALARLRSTCGNAKVGIVTFDSTIEFHDLSSAERKSKLVTDVDDPFCPIPPSQWLVRLSDKFDELNALMDILYRKSTGFEKQNKTNDSPGIQSIASAALFACAQGLQTTGGKISFFTGALSTRGRGKLINREDGGRQYGSEKEFHMLRPKPTEHDEYKALAASYAEHIISVDLYCMTNNFIDLAALSVLANETGGTINHFPALELGDEVTKAQFFQALERAVTSVRAIDAVMKVRTSTGFRFGGFLGCGHRPTGVEEQYLGYIHSNTTIALGIDHEGSDLSKHRNMYVQLAVLYTSVNGERRLRIHNLSLKLVDSYADVFRYADIDALSSYLARKCARLAVRKAMDAVHKELNVSVVAMLTAYRKHCAKNPSHGQLILPDALKLLPVYTLALLKSPLLRRNRPKSTPQLQRGTLVPTMMRADARVAAINHALISPVANWMRLLYPQMCVLQAGGLNLPNQSNPLPALVAPTMAKVPPAGFVFVSNGEESLLYVCDGAPSELITELTGSPGLTEQVKLHSEENVDPARMKGQLLHCVKHLSNFNNPVEPLEAVRVIQQHSAQSALFSHMLTEDKQNDLYAMESYEDFLCKIHASIKSELAK